MDLSTHDLVRITLVLISFVLFSLAMLAVVLRAGPKRGTWNQPAAELRAPGKRMSIGLYVAAALHVITGIILAVAMPGGGIAILVVLVVTACFYVLFAQSYALAHKVVARREHAPDAR